MKHRSWLTGTCLCLALGTGVHAETFHVPGDAATIQGAIDLASDSDVIEVAEGTYFEAIDFRGKAIVVRAAVDGTYPTIDASLQGDAVVSFLNAETELSELRGLRLIGGDGRTAGTMQRGGGIYISGADPTIVDCIIEGNSADTGGGAWVRWSYARFDRCRFIGNSASSFGDGGGGIHLLSGSPQLTNCVFEQNTSGASGGGASAVVTSTLLRNCVFVDNEASSGGAFDAVSSSALLVNCTVHGNRAVLTHPDFCGGVRSTLESSVTVQNSVFWDNLPSDAVALGGQLVIERSSLSEDWTGPGEENIVGDPRFRADRRRLLPTSACIDQGALEFYPGADDRDETDADALPRSTDGDLDQIVVIDIGAYEYVAGSVVVGSCCYSDGTCNLDSSDGCEARGGTYNGDASECGEVVCEALGACCLGESCSTMTESDCLTASGEYLGDSAACESNSCVVPDPEGACCLASGICILASPELCNSIAGVYGGTGTDCADGCDGEEPPTGACCVGSTCTVETEAACVDLGGTYGGDATSCDTMVCACEGDASADGVVNFDDLLMVLMDWGPCAGCVADMTGDGLVDFNDVLTVLTAWGNCP